MENPEKVILTNMCMIFDGTKLLVQEKVGKGFKGITCPGGHVEPGEPIVDSVIREIKEETGLTIKSPKLCGIKDWFEEDGSRYMVFIFRADNFEGSLTSSEEGCVFWTELSELKKLPTMWLEVFCYLTSDILHLTSLPLFFLVGRRGGDGRG